MKTKLIILAVLALTQAIRAQELIRVRKTPKQEEQTSIATIAGLYYGSCSYTQLLTDKKIRISNNSNGRYRIIFFNTTFNNKGSTALVGNGGDSLSTTLLDILDKYYIAASSKTTKIWFDAITAVDNFSKDTVFLNPIVITIKGR